VIDPITLEIVRHRLAGINDEAAITLRQVSGSQIAVEANDLNTAITTGDGTVVACGNYVLCQVASLNLVTADILAHYRDDPGIRAGDQFLTNDPYVGSLHQPDVVVVAPVFFDDRLVAWCGSTVHQPDVGGPSHGGLALDSGSIFDEPLPVPPVRIVEHDRIRRDIERGYLIRSRTPQLNALDLAGQIAANRASVAAIQALCRRYGADAVVEAMARLLDAAEAQLRARLASLPDGRWRHVAYLEHGAPQPDDSDVYAVRLTATKRGESLELDFSSSSAQAPGSINAAYPALVSFTVAAVLVHLCGDLLWVPGAVGRVVRIASRAGTVVHARWPAGVAMSTATSCQAIRVSVGACLARMLDASPELAEHAMASCQSAGAGGGIFSGVDADGEPFGSMTLDELTGGGGATPRHDGADSSGSTTSPGAGCANVEVNESYLPLLYLHRRELANSAGPGRQRGGVGCVIAVRPHRTPEPVRVLSFAQGLQHPAAPGLAGGDPGRQSVFAIGDGTLTPGGRYPLPTATAVLGADDVHVAVTQGGGGYGDPLDRPPADVLADVSDGLVSLAAADHDYGVVIRAHRVDEAAGRANPQVDEPATAATRAELRADETVTAARPPDPQADETTTTRPPELRADEAATTARPPEPRADETTTTRPPELRVDEAATAAVRATLRRARIGGREPAPPLPARPGRRFGDALDLVDGAVVCARCGHQLGRDPYAAVAVTESPVAVSAPWDVHYPGGERFVLRRLHCPSCAAQIDVQIALRTDPIVPAAGPLS